MITTNKTMLPAFEETYVYKNQQHVRHYLATSKLDEFDIHWMSLSNYRNHTNEDNTKSDWVTKLRPQGIAQQTVTQELYVNYFKATTGLRHSRKYSLLNATKYETTQYDVVKWHDETEQQFKDIVKQYAVKGSCGRAKRPVFYTAGIRYKTGHKGYAVNAAALLVLDETNQKILCEVIKMGGFMYTHTPVEETNGVIEKRNSKTGNVDKTFERNNAYAYSVYTQNDVEVDDWEDEWDFEDEVEADQEQPEVEQTITQPEQPKAKQATVDLSDAMLDALLIDVDFELQPQQPVVATKQNPVVYTDNRSELEKQAWDNAFDELGY